MRDIDFKICTNKYDGKTPSNVSYTGNKGEYRGRINEYGYVKNIVQCPACSTFIVVKVNAKDSSLNKRILVSKMETNVPRLTIPSENGNVDDICNTCDKRETEVSCIECAQNLCFDCAKFHLKSSSTRRHHITGIVPKVSQSAVIKPTIKEINDNIPFSNYTDTSVSPRQNGSQKFSRRDVLSPRIAELRQRQLDIYQRGNSPRPELKQSFDFQPLTPVGKGWGFDFSLISTFEVGSYVLSLCPAERDQCWVAETSSPDIHLYNSEGQHIKSIEINSEVRDIALNKATGELYISCFASKQIKVATPDGEVVPFASLDLHPAGIAIGIWGELIVCGVQDYRRRYKPEHKNRLFVYSTRDGRLMKEIERGSRGRLFCYPEYIDININGDICVSDIEKECVTILRDDGRVKCVYKGPPKGRLDKPFDPRDLKCDREGNILVCDINNNAIHVLSIYGEFDKLLLTGEDGLYWPDVLAVDHRNHIWVRELWQNTVKVFQNIQ